MKRWIPKGLRFITKALGLGKTSAWMMLLGVLLLVAYLLVYLPMLEEQFTGPFDFQPAENSEQKE